MVGTGAYMNIEVKRNVSGFLEFESRVSSQQYFALLIYKCSSWAEVLQNIFMTDNDQRKFKTNITFTINMIKDFLYRLIFKKR